MHTMVDRLALPENWENFLVATRGLAENGFSVRFGEADGEAIEELAERYDISRAAVVRILVHKALRGT